MPRPSITLTITIPAATGARLHAYADRKDLSPARAAAALIDAGLRASERATVAGQRRAATRSSASNREAINARWSRAKQAPAIFDRTNATHRRADGRAVTVTIPENPPRITDEQIHQLRAEALDAGDDGLVAIALAALGRPHYRIVAVLPDGQTFVDEAHLGLVAGHPFETEADTVEAIAALEADRPDGHDAITYRAHRVQPDPAWARTQCAIAIAEAAAQLSPA